MQQLPNDKQANPKCKDYYGRGYIRWRTDTKTEFTEKLCHCVKDKAIKEKEKTNEDN